MAYIDVIGSTETTITVCIRDLTEPTSNYSQFRARAGTASYATINAGSSNLIDGNNSGRWRSPNIVITSGISCGNSYTISGDSYTNTWYSATSRTASTSACPSYQPPVPTGLTVSAVSYSELRVRWNSVSTATSYQLNNQQTGQTRTVTGTEEYWGGLNPSTRYDFRVRSRNSGGYYSDWSSYANGSTPARPVAPSTPTNFKAQATSSSRVLLTWDNMTRANGYDIYRDGYYHTSTTSTSYAMTGLSEYTLYDFNVIAYGDGGSSTSASTAMRTLDQTNPTVYITTGYPTATKDTVTVRWSASDAHSGIGSFEVYIRVKGGTWGYISKTSSSTEHTFTDRLENTDYEVYVKAFDRAVNSNGNSAPNTAQTVIGTVKTQAGMPNGFTWTNSKTAGQPFNVLASEWLALQQKVNEFREYKNLPLFSFFDTFNGNNSFTRPYSGQVIRDYHFNQARNAIAGMAASVPPSVSTGGSIRAGSATASNRTDGLNGLRNALNAVT